jgi:ubiquinone/menaquinone biosynthesis C-methylase UbiE
MASKYHAALQSRGGLRATVRKYGFVRVLDAGLREAWESVGMRVLRALGHGPRERYGWLAALLSPTCDYWLRYTHVIRALESFAATGVGKTTRVLEVASGSRGGVAWALQEPANGRELCLVDVSDDLLRDPRGGRAWRVCANGCQLPFADNSFDVVISLDTVEHLPNSQRTYFFKEMRRIARQAVIVTCPLQSGDGVFQARDFDLTLAQTITARRGTFPDWLREHLAQGHPTQKEICQLLPGAEIKGAESCSAWMRLASLYQRNFLWMFAGIYYLLRVRKNDTQPPYRRALLIWRKTAPALDVAVTVARTLTEEPVRETA